MVADAEIEVWLIRHGETEWSKSGKHTSITDLPLTEHGVEVARELAPRLKGVAFDLVLSSPRQRARHTAELVGYPDPEIDADLVEWHYGDYEGMTRHEIRERVPAWSVWTHPAPGGETAQHVADRLDRVVSRVVTTGGRALVFGHGHALRALTARWILQPVSEGRFFKLDTSTLSVLGYDREVPVILRWNS